MSGGLDSQLAVRVLQRAGAEVEGVCFETPFFSSANARKAAAALAVLENHDFAAVHLEAPDECTHNGDLEGKISSIEQLDSRIIAPLVEGLKNRGWDWRMLVISDHKTLTSTRGHDGDCVPFILYDSRKSQGSGLEYNEKNGLKGPTVSDGSRLMDLLFEK